MRGIRPICRLNNPTAKFIDVIVMLAKFYGNTPLLSKTYYNAINIIKTVILSPPFILD